MSKEVSIFRDATNVVAPAGGGVDEITRRLMGNSNYKRISIAGGKFRMVVNGQETARSNNDSMDIVIVNAAPHVSRSFYAKTFDPKNTGVPDCWSNDGVRPDSRAEAPQGRTCDSCPKNIAGSGQNGTRACRYNRRFAVVLANDITNSDVFQLQLPATSLFGKGEDGKMPFDAYIKQVAGMNFSVTGVVTEMRFDETAVGGPRLVFRAVRPLTQEERAVVSEKGASPEAESAISFNPGQIDSAGTQARIAPPPVARRESEESIPEPTVRKSKTPTPPLELKSAEQMLDEWTDD